MGGAQRLLPKAQEKMPYGVRKDISLGEKKKPSWASDPKLISSRAFLLLVRRRKLLPQDPPPMA